MSLALHLEALLLLECEMPPRVVQLNTWSLAGDTMEGHHGAQLEEMGQWENGLEHHTLVLLSSLCLARTSHFA